MILHGDAGFDFFMERPSLINQGGDIICIIYYNIVSHKYVFGDKYPLRLLKFSVGNKMAHPRTVSLQPIH